MRGLQKWWFLRTLRGFQFSPNLITHLSPADVEYLYLRTNDNGPLMDDLFIGAVTKNGTYEFPLDSEKGLSKYLLKFRNLDHERLQQILSSRQHNFAVFWQRDPILNYSPTTQSNLRERLLKLLVTLTTDDQRVVDNSKILIDAYLEPHRFYHTLRHIHHCLFELDKLKLDRLDQILIELVIWFHDLVYEPGSMENEIKSAQKFSEMFSDAKPEFSSLVQEFILASTHSGDDRGYSECVKIFLDIDMSILGSHPVVFFEYEMEIRQEFTSIAPEVFFGARRRFLEGLLSRDIFYTAMFKEKYEGQAKDNITRLLESPAYKLRKY